MSDEMAEAHSRDSQAEGRMREAAGAIDAVTAEPHRLNEQERFALMEQAGLLRAKADHIVAVWD
jgi:hypothetical protein